MWTNEEQEKELVKMQLVSALKSTRDQSTYFTLEELTNIIIEGLGEEADILAKKVVNKNKKS
jgi:hypothetical protein